MFDAKAFVAERNNAFIEAVVNDNLKPFYKYCRKYKMLLPPNKKLIRAAIYKATHECTDIPDEIKAIADEKCKALGFEPGIQKEETANEQNNSASRNHHSGRTC